MFHDVRTQTADRVLRSLWDDRAERTLRPLFHDQFRFRNLNGGDDVTDLTGLRLRTFSVRANHPGGRVCVEEIEGSDEHLAVWWTFRDRGGDDCAGASWRARPTVLSGTCVIHLSGNKVTEMCELSGVLGDSDF
jgi:hypothetical protein